MAKVLITVDGQHDFDALPVVIKNRVIGIFGRLALWPEVSGAKPLRGEWAGHYRIRTGDWRVIFREVEPGVLVVRIQNREGVYED